MSRIAVVGYGNLGAHLVPALSAFFDVTVFSRRSIEIEYQNLDDLVPGNFEYVFLCLPDAQIAPFAKDLPISNATILHSSGTQSIKNLSKHEKRGVFYPLQTFSKQKKIDFRKVPIYLEAEGADVQELQRLATSISDKVKLANSNERARLHLAAVFACNFTNHLFYIAEEILENTSMKLEDLRPLIDETISKAMTLGARNAQTGPAIRNDQSTIEAHIRLIEDKQSLEIYEQLTNSIQGLYQ
ncbi:MAG: DUF2520 domain-containing protein [Bacteroidota bacterium]